MLADLPAPTDVLIRVGTGETSFNATWKAGVPPSGGVGAVATPNGYLLRYMDTMSSPAVWTEVRCGAPNATVQGLRRGDTYRVEIVTLYRPEQSDVRSLPWKGSVAMLPDRAEQDSFFSVYVPSNPGQPDAGHAYLRLGPADHSGTVEGDLSKLWTDTIAPSAPVSRDLGRAAQTGAVLYATRDAAIVSGGSIRLRTSGAVSTYSAASDSATTRNTVVVKTRDSKGDAAGTGVVTYVTTHDDLGAWWTTRYDRAYGLSFSESTSGAYSMGANYAFSLGISASNRFASGVATTVSAADISVGHTGLAVAIGWNDVATKVRGVEQAFKPEATTMAGKVRWTLANPANPAHVTQAAALKQYATATLALSTLVTTFGAYVTASEWKYLAGAGSSTAADPASEISVWLTGKSVPFYLSCQAANALIFAAGVVIGRLQSKLAAAAAATPVGTSIEMSNDGDALGLVPPPPMFGSVPVQRAAPFIRLQNGDPVTGTELFMDRGQSELRAGFNRVQVTPAALTVYHDAGELKLTPDACHLSALVPLRLSSPVGIELRCGPNAIELRPDGIRLNGIQLTMEALRATFGPPA